MTTAPATSFLYEVVDHATGEHIGSWQHDAMPQACRKAARIAGARRSTAVMRLYPNGIRVQVVEFLYRPNWKDTGWHCRVCDIPLYKCLGWQPYCVCRWNGLVEGHSKWGRLSPAKPTPCNQCKACRETNFLLCWTCHTLAKDDLKAKRGMRRQALARDRALQPNHLASKLPHARPNFSDITELLNVNSPYTNEIIDYATGEHLGDWREDAQPQAYRKAIRIAATKSTSVVRHHPDGSRFHLEDFHAHHFKSSDMHCKMCDIPLHEQVGRREYCRCRWNALVDVDGDAKWGRLKPTSKYSCGDCLVGNFFLCWQCHKSTAKHKDTKACSGVRKRRRRSERMRLAAVARLGPIVLTSQRRNITYTVYELLHPWDTSSAKQIGEHVTLANRGQASIKHAAKVQAMTLTLTTGTTTIISECFSPNLPSITYALRSGPDAVEGDGLYQREYPHPDEWRKSYIYPALEGVKSILPFTSPPRKPKPSGTPMYEITFEELGYDGTDSGSGHAEYRVARGKVHGTFYPPRSWKTPYKAREWLFRNFYQGEHPLGKEGADFFNINHMIYVYRKGMVYPRSGDGVVLWVIPELEDERQRDLVEKLLKRYKVSKIEHWVRKGVKTPMFTTQAFEVAVKHPPAPALITINNQPVEV